MKRSMLTAGLTLAVVAGLTAAPAASGATSASTAAPSPAADPRTQAVAAADRAVASGLDSFAKGQNERFERRLVTPWVKDLYSVAYERTYRGLPVVGGDAVVMVDGKGKVKATQGATRTKITVTTKPTVSAAQAEKTSRAQLEHVDEVEQTRLVVRVLDDVDHLAWETVVSGEGHEGMSRLFVYVDALTGDVLETYDVVENGAGTSEWNGPNPLSISTTGSGGSYSLKDPTRTGVACGSYSARTPMTGTDDVWGNGDASSIETGCVDAMFASQKQWDMLGQWLGRNGLNGNGGGWPVYVGMNQVNATWNGSYVSIGKNNAGEWIASADVIAHENGHGIDQHTPGGANNESGLGEATGDIFGALTEAYMNQPTQWDEPDYLVGETINLVGDGPIRNMYDPSQKGDPNCWSSAIPSTPVHAAAGPLNHWFYLLAEGSNPTNGMPASPTCNNSTVTGVGIQDAGKIFYGGMLLKTSGMTHFKYRVATLTAAKNLDATCTLYNRTKAAWNAISVPAQSSEPTCSPSTVDDFSMTLNPTAGSVQPGASTTATVATTTTAGSAQSVALTATGQPAGVSVSFSPSTVSSGASSTMTVSTTASAAPGTYVLTIKGTGKTSHTVQYTLTIGGTTDPGTTIPDISIANIQAHLTQFQNIATSNGGNRRAGTAGYTASLNYVKSKLTAAGYTVSEQYCSTCTYPSNNLIADWPGGASDQVTMFGAHLDGVSAGAGINDNASGSAALLETALALAEKKPTMGKHVRFAWWTDEEQGLNGSEFYVNSLSSTARSAIKGYYNFDMIGSTNGGYFINNISSTTSAPMKAYWDSLNLQPEENVEGQGRSDDASFKAAGIPTSGYASGASATKTSAQASKWGGTAGRAYDPCYHRSCDTTSNINPTLLNRAADGIAYTLWKTSVSAPVGNDFSVSVSPSSGSVTPGSSTTATVSTATTSGTAQTVNLSASGQPSGVTVSFSPSSVQSGGRSTMTVTAASTAAAGTYTLTVKGTGAVSRSATYTLTVGTAGGCTARNVVGNGGFESGSAPWTASSGVITSATDYPNRSGSYKAWFAGYGQTHTDTASQSVTIPSGCTSYQLAFYLRVDSAESTTSTAYDRFTVQLGTKTLATYSNLNETSGYVLRTMDVGSYAGQTVTLKFTGTEDSSLQTSFLLDDVALNVS